jgi:hypothetical protein
MNFWHISHQFYQLIELRVIQEILKYFEIQFYHVTASVLLVPELYGD